MKRKYTRFRPKIRSRHPSHRVLRGKLPLMSFRSVIRLGSSTELRDTKRKGGNRIEINTTEAIANSSNKRRMKTCFTKYNVRTAVWYQFRAGQLYNETSGEVISIENLDFPIIAKRHFGSRGKGNTKLDSLEKFKAFIKNKSLNNYIFERYYNYAKEYRLHVTEDGCFYACRKMMKRDTPENKKWFKNNENCVWILPTNKDFDKPVNWSSIEKECVKALKSVGLDFGAIDLRVQNSTEGRIPAFIVVEINSAPSFGNITEEKYKEMLPKLLMKKSKI